MFKKAIIAISLISGLNADLLADDFKQETIDKIQIVYNEGKKIKASDGMTFEKTLSAQFGVETTWGYILIGDKWKNGKLKSLYKSSLGGLQVKLSTAKITIKKYKHLMEKYSYFIYDGKDIYKRFNEISSKLSIMENFKNKDDIFYIREEIKNNKNYKKIIYYSGILNSETWKRKFKQKDRQALLTFEWAKRELKYHNAIFESEKTKIYKSAMKKYKKFNDDYKTLKIEQEKLSKKASKDRMLINKLLTDLKFNSEIAGHYLLSMYELALRKGFKNPYRKAIGRYNGGWNNKVYFPKVIKKIKTINTLIRKNYIK